MHHYQMVKGIAKSEEGENCQVFGIRLTDGAVFPDLSTDEQRVAELVKAANLLQLDPIQLEEVVLDFVNEDRML